MAKSTALRSKDFRLERGRPETADYIPPDDRILELIENEPGEGVASVYDETSSDAVDFWMSGVL